MIKVDSAQVALEQAQKYWQAKQWQLTIEACAKALAMDRQLTLGQKLMGDALQKMGKSKEAVGYYLQAIALKPDFAEVYVNLGSLCANQKQWAEAIEYYQQALTINPELITVHQHLARILQLQQKSTVKTNILDSTPTLKDYLRQGAAAKKEEQLETAFKQYQLAAKIAPQNVDIYRQLADISERLKRWEDAAGFYRTIWQLTNQPDRHIPTQLIAQSKTVEIPQLTPAVTVTGDLDLQVNSESNSAEYHYNLGIIQSRQQQWQQAIYHFQQALIGDPQMAKAYCDLARTLASIGQLEQSLKYWLGAISLESKGISAAEYLELAQNLIEQQKYKYAITCYHRAIEQQPDLAEAYLGWAELLIRSGAIKQAFSCYLKGLKYIPNNPEIYYRLGSLYQKVDKLSQAAICYQKATQYQPDHPQANHQLGEILSQQEHWSEAIAAYRQAIKGNRDFSWSYNNLGYALIQAGQWSEAIPIYKQAIALNPDFPWAYYNLAEAYSMIERWESAINYYQQAAKIQPDLPHIQPKLGEALYRRSQQDLQQALQSFMAAIANDPQNTAAYHQALAIDQNNIELYLRLGDVLVEQGKVDEAVVTYQMALQIQPKNSSAIARLEHLQKKTLI